MSFLIWFSSVCYIVWSDVVEAAEKLFLTGSVISRLWSDWKPTLDWGTANLFISGGCWMLMLLESLKRSSSNNNNNKSTWVSLRPVILNTIRSTTCKFKGCCKKCVVFFVLRLLSPHLSTTGCQAQPTFTEKHNAELDNCVRSVFRKGFVKLLVHPTHRIGQWAAMPTWDASSESNRHNTSLVCTVSLMNQPEKTIVVSTLNYRVTPYIQTHICCSDSF